MPEISPSHTVLQKLVFNPLDYAGLSSPGCANRAGSSHQGNSRLLSPRKEPIHVVRWGSWLQHTQSCNPHAFRLYIVLFIWCSILLVAEHPCGSSEDPGPGRRDPVPTVVKTSGLLGHLLVDWCLTHKVLRGSGLHKDYFQTPQLGLNIS